ncbi:MAG: hypothetical protein HZB16_20820 [Armatimonadetes bacterium]|nr:hypothetical protein [Armatimonadota bacterium]
MRRTIPWCAALVCLLSGALGAQPVVDPAQPGLDADATVRPGYAFITGDLGLNRITKYDAAGKPYWYYTQISPIDVWPMPDGTVLAAYLPSPLTAGKGGVRLINPDQSTVFDFAFDDEIMSVQPLTNGHFLLAECHFGRITEFDRQGQRIKSFNVLTPPSGHTTMRQIRLMPDGSLVAAECYSHKLRTYSRDGKLLREIDQEYPYCPFVLPNGNVLVGCWNHPKAKVVEFDAKGQLIWTLLPAELPPAMNVTHISEAIRLASGNTLVSVCCGAGGAGVARAMLFEVTPEKKVVWQITDRVSATRVSTVKVIGPEHLKAAPPGG